MAAAMNSGDTSALNEVVRYLESVGDSSNDATITDAGSRVSLLLEKHDGDRLAQDDASEALQNSASIGTGSAHEACASENTLNTQEGVTLHSARQTQTMLLRDVCGVLRKSWLMKYRKEGAADSTSSAGSEYSDATFGHV